MIPIAPLKGSFMIASMLGFFISAIWVYEINPKFGFAFSLVFTLMFVASLISMTYAPVPDK
ncbi:MAG: hypothetical protein V1837_07580 [Candidatus Woesearchaeota archaeon]